MFHHIRPRDKTNVGRPDIGQSIRRNRTDVGHSRKDQNRSPIPAISSPRPMEPIKRRYQTGFRLRGKSPSNPCIRPLPGSCRLTQQKRLYMKKFSRDTAISPKQIGDFFRRFLKRSCPASPANFKQQRDMDDNDGNKKKEATMRCLRLRPRLPIPVFYFNPILSLITYTAPSRFASLLCLAGTIRGLTL